jgi:hypothetical protein
MDRAESMECTKPHGAELSDISERSQPAAPARNVHQVDALYMGQSEAAKALLQEFDTFIARKQTNTRQTVFD